MRWIEEESFERLAEDLEGRGFSTSWIKEKVKSFKVETPSWGYRDSGTRFAVFHQPGAARDVHECLEDAAFVHRLTGACPSVALHIPWDRVEDFGALREEAEAKGVRIGAINPNLFQDPDYKFGSLANPKPEVRKKALEHIFECIDIMEQVGSEVLSLWFADGTDYPGQGDFRRRKAWMEEGLREVYDRLPGKSRMLIEYKFFEPAFYHTDIPDWGTAYALATKLGPKAQVLVDTGHHPQGTNIEFLVA
ncbi:MAG TPA: sugar isomerase, partial [Firmicutes bacterium]|nr:sugar isomerase [Bacillota bacterium]